MENPNPNSTSNNRIFHTNRTKNNASISMSDTESQVSFYSPYPFDSPLSSDDPVVNPNSLAVVSVGKLVTKKKSPSRNLSYPATPPATPPSLSHLMMFNREVKDGVALGVENGRAEEEVGGGGGERRARVGAGRVSQRPEWVVVVKKVALGFRICEVILCMMSFSVMAADRTRGWSGDSYYRYREYRYLVGVNIIGLLHSGYQACSLAYHLVIGKHAVSDTIPYYFVFLIDQMLAYLLMSASSSAATRLLDWVSNWGKDAFTNMAGASIWISFLAFFAFALSSLICGYSICCCSQDSSSSL